MWKILVVDDDERNCELLIQTLNGVAVCEKVLNGEDALVAYNRAMESNEQYDLILLDVAMPGIDGMDVLKAIRHREESRGIELGFGTPIIMVTAYKEPFMDAFNLGCDDYVLKPIDPDELLKKVEDKLSSKG